MRPNGNAGYGFTHKNCRQDEPLHLVHPNFDDDEAIVNWHNFHAVGGYIIRWEGKQGSGEPVFQAKCKSVKRTSV